MTAVQTPVAAGRRRRFGLMWVAIVGIAQFVAIAAGFGPPLQPALSIAFVLTCPGFLILDLDQPSDPSARLMLGIGGSLTVNVAVFTAALVVDSSWIIPAVVVALASAALVMFRRWRTDPQPVPANKAGLDQVVPGASDPGAGDHVVGDTPTGDPVAGTRAGSRVADSDLVDINTADDAELAELPGVGMVLAERAVAYRDAHGPFATVDDLTAVSGFGSHKVDAIRGLVTVSPPAEV